MINQINRENDPRWDKLQAYVLEVAHALRLKDWQIKVSKTRPSGEEFVAECSPVEGQLFATLYFNDDFFTDSDPKSQRQTVCHELLHCHMANHRDVIRVELGGMRALSQREYELIYAMHNRQLEYTVDNLAYAFAPFMPLPQLEG